MNSKKLIKFIQKKADFEKVIIKPILANDYSTTIKKITDEQLKAIIENYISNDFFSFLKGCINIFDREYIAEENVYLGTNDDIKTDYKLFLQTSLKIKKFSRIIDVNIDNHGVKLEDENDVENLQLISSNPHEWNVNLDISNFNKYTGEVLIFGTLSGSEHNHVLYDNNYTIVLSVEGLKNDSTHPIWAESLIDGYLELQNGNNKNAFLNFFASSDYLINFLHELIFEYYLKEISSNGINDDVKKKIRKLSNKRQRLQDKLLNIGDELNIDIKKINCYKKWVQFTSIRDTIAHGGKYVCSYDLKEVLIDIITLIMTLLSGVNIEEKGWKNVVK